MQRREENFPVHVVIGLHEVNMKSSHQSPAEPVYITRHDAEDDGTDHDNGTDAATDEQQIGSVHCLEEATASRKYDLRGDGDSEDADDWYHVEPLVAERDQDYPFCQ